MYTPRDYQECGIEASINILTSIKPKREIVVSPTAGGKSLYVAFAAMSVDFPLIVLQPSKELLQQNYKKFLELGGEAEIYSASMKSRNLGKVTFATIGSIRKEVDKVKALGVKGIIIDEAHLGTQSDSSIRNFITACGIKNVLGLTATPIYLKGGIDGAELKMMNRVKGALFRDIAHVTQISELVEKNFWSRLLYIEEEIDETLLDLNTNGSDYTLESQKKFYEGNALQNKIISYIDRLRRDNRKSILVFVPSIEEAMALEKLLPGSKSVYSGISDKERDQIIIDFKNLEIDVVINVNILSVGFDHPQLDAIITARATNSIAIYYQQIGRGVRIHPLKKNCRVIDLSGNVKNFGKVEKLNFEYIDGWGWGMFTEDKLLSNYPMQAKRRPTKESLRLGVKRKSLGLRDRKDGIKIWFGKYNGKTLEEVHKENENYLSWMIDNFDFNGIKMKNLKKEIEIILNL